MYYKSYIIYKSVCIIFKIFLNQAPKIICRVESFVKLIKKLDDSRREEVEKMGFSGLLEMKLGKLDRRFCYWLMTRVDAEGHVEFGDGNVFRFTPQHVQSIFGLPMGTKDVPAPVAIDWKDQQMVRPAIELFKMYGTGVADPSKDMVLLAKVAKVVEGEKDSAGEVIPLSTPGEKLAFRNAFLAVVVGHLLCPTAMCTNLSHKLMAVVSLGGVAEEYDWCTWTYNRLMERVEVFLKSFYDDGYARGCGGCVVALMVRFVSHFNLFI